MALSTTCGLCGVFVQAKPVSEPTGSKRGWYQCPNCNAAIVKQVDGSVYPPAPAGGTVPNLPADVEKAWQEARVSHNVAAYTASEIMCRKILMHLAVDRADSKPGKGFVDYVNDLEKGGYIATGLKPTVDSIRSRGNAANHELPASTEEESLQTLRITQHLLESVYAFGDVA